MWEAAQSSRSAHIQTKMHRYIKTFCARLRYRQTFMACLLKLFKRDAYQTPKSGSCSEILGSTRCSSSLLGSRWTSWEGIPVLDGNVDGVTDSAGPEECSALASVVLGRSMAQVACSAMSSCRPCGLELTAASLACFSASSFCFSWALSRHVDALWNVRAQTGLHT